MAYSKQIVISHNNVSADLTNFPCTVYLNDSNFDFTKCATSGDDIRFTDGSNALKHECKQFTPACSRINTTTVTGTDYIFYQKLSLITVANTTVLEAGIKIETSGTLGCQWLCVANGTKQGIILIGDGFVTFNFNLSPKTIYTNTSDKIHIYKIKFNGTTSLDYYIDGILIYSYTYANLYADTNNRIFFGDGQGSANYGGSALYTYVTYCLDYVNNPGAVVTLNCATTLPTNAGWTAVISQGTIALITNIAVYNVLLLSVSSTIDTIFYVKCGDSVEIYNKSIEAWQDQTRKRLTYNGNVCLIPPQTKFGNGAYVSNNTQSLTIASTDFVVGSADFTIDCWAATTLSTPYGVIFGKAAGTGGGQWSYYMCINSNGSISAYVESSMTDYSANSAAGLVLKNTLNHYAMVRSGTMLYGYLNGVMVCSTSLGTLTVNNQGTFTIGNLLAGNTTYNFIGYIDELRFSNIARWTSNFTPPTSEYVVDTNTKLLMHMNVLPFVDECGKTVTNNAAITSTSTTTGRCAYFDGTGDYFNLGGQSDLAFDTGDFCIEMNVKLLSNVSCNLYDARPSGSNGVYMFFGVQTRSSVQKFSVYVNSTYVIDSTTIAIAGNTYNICVARSSGITKLFINGIQEGSSYADSNAYLNGANAPFIGSSLNGYFYGMRVTKGRARYTTTFTPPTSFSIDGSDVAFCSNFDSIYDQNYVMVQHMTDNLTDATGNNNSGTATGITVIDDSLYGKVSNFISTTKITIPDSNSLDLTSNITLTAFTEYTNSVNSTFMEKSSDNTNYQFQTGIGGTGKFEFRPSYVASPTVLSTITCSDGVYRVFHGVQNGTSTKLYRDGTLDASGTYSPPVANTSPLTIGDRTGGIGITGRISEMRISNNARTDSWIKAESLALKGSLLTFLSANVKVFTNNMLSTAKSSKATVKVFNLMLDVATKFSYYIQTLITTWFGYDDVVYDSNLVKGYDTNFSQWRLDNAPLLKKLTTAIKLTMQESRIILSCKVALTKVMPINTRTIAIVKSIVALTKQTVTNVKKAVNKNTTKASMLNVSSFAKISRFFKQVMSQSKYIASNTRAIFRTYFEELVSSIKYKTKQVQFTKKSNVQIYKATSSQKKSVMLIKLASMQNNTLGNKKTLKVMLLVVRHMPIFAKSLIIEMIVGIKFSATAVKKTSKESVLNIKLVNVTVKDVVKSFILSIREAITTNKQVKKLKLFDSIDISSNTVKQINKSKVSTVKSTMDYTKDIKKSLHTYENAIAETSKATTLDRLIRTHAFVSFSKQANKIVAQVTVIEVKINRFMKKQNVIATKVNSNATKLIQKSFSMVLEYTSLATSRIFHQVQEFWVKANGLWHKLESLMIKDSKGDYQHIYELKQKEKNQWKH
jgi:hypothetical protein